VKFAKICKVLRFVLLAFVILYMGILALGLLELTMPELSPDPRPHDEVVANVINIAVYTVVFLVIDIICFVVYASHKKALKKQRDEDRKIDGGSKRKTKKLLLALGIVAILVGMMGSVAYPMMSWVTLLGIVLIIASLCIRVRRHAMARKAKYKYDGNKLEVLYPEKPTVDKYYFIGSQCSEIIQDIINDGYLNFEKFEQTDNGQVRLTFSTDFSREELQKQHDRRDKLFSGERVGAMPEYYSEKSQTIYHLNITSGEPYQKKEEVYIYDEYEIYEDGHKVRTEQRNKRFSHYELITLQDETTFYKFYNLDETPFCDRNGNQLIVSSTEAKELERKKI